MSEPPVASRRPAPDTDDRTVFRRFTIAWVVLAPFAVALVWIAPWDVAAMEWAVVVPIWVVMSGTAQLATPAGRVLVSGNTMGAMAVMAIVPGASVLAITGAAVAESLEMRLDQHRRLLRLIPNLALLIIAGVLTATVYERLRSDEPTVTASMLLLGVLVAVVYSTTNVALVTVGAALVYGREGLFYQMREPFLVHFGQQVVLGVAGSWLALVVLSVGYSTVPLLVVIQAGASMLVWAAGYMRWRHADVVGALAQALDARGIIRTEAAVRLERLAVAMAEALGLEPLRIADVRYLVLLYAMTDDPADEVPLPVEELFEPTRLGVEGRHLLSFGDVSDSEVEEIVDAAAEYDVLTHPGDHGPALAPEDAVAFLERTGTDLRLLRALEAAITARP